MSTGFLLLDTDAGKSLGTQSTSTKRETLTHFLDIMTLLTPNFIPIGYLG